MLSSRASRCVAAESWKKGVRSVPPVNESRGRGGKGTRRSLTLLLLRLLLYVYRDALKGRGPVRYLVHRPVVLALLFVLVEPSAARGPRPPGGSAPEQTSTFVRHPSSCHALFFQKKKKRKEKRPLPSGPADANPRRRVRVNPRSLAPGLNATCSSLATLGLSRMAWHHLESETHDERKFPVKTRSFQSTKEGESCGVRCLWPSKTELALCILRHLRHRKRIADEDQNPRRQKSPNETELNYFRTLYD